jgi:glucose/arabinose dehydrogenase
MSIQARAAPKLSSSTSSISLARGLSIKLISLAPLGTMRSSRRACARSGLGGIHVGERHKSLCRTIAIAALCVCGVAAEARSQLRSIVHASGFSFPVAIVQDPTDDAVQFVVEQDGRIRVVQSGVVLATDFLDLRTAVSSGGERGLLGLALAPDYAASGRFFVHFTSATDGGTVVSRFTRSANPLVADAASRFDLRWSGGATTIPHPFANHNGGHLAFGSDGYLYIGIGDGGSGGDPFNLAQNPSTLLGKFLRIDVNVPASHATGYQVPADNPFIGGVPAGIRPEIWSVGWRNPWRYSFDDVSRGGTGALIAGDVGQSMFEEINYEPANRGGRNYGWDLREGAHNYDPSTTPAFLPLTDPIAEYGRAAGASVTGGYVYRGSALGSLYQGRYFFADFVSGRVWSVTLTIDPGTGEATASGLTEHTSELGAGALGNISSFGVDSDGELFILSYFSGTVLKVVAAPPPTITATASVSIGSVITVTVANGPGFVSDWVMMVPEGSPQQTWGQYKYLSNSRTRPASGLTNATITFDAPNTSGRYEFRFYHNDSWTLLATSGVVTVNAPTLTVNGGMSPITVNGGSIITVGVSNGPGNISDWVMMVPAGSPPETWGTYMYLSGSRTRPATGMSNATLNFTAPSAGGQFEFRFYHNDMFILLQTSSVVTVTAGTNPVPTLSSLSPTSASAGSGALTLTVNGAGFVQGSEVRVDGSARTTTFVSSTQLTAALPATDIANVGAKAITVVSPAPGGGTSSSLSFGVTPAVSGPALTINGSSNPATVAPGSTIAVGVSNGPGNISDWVMMVPAGSPPQTWGTYMYLSGSRTRPVTALMSATIQFVAPPSGSYEFRFYQNDSFTLLATSSVVTVQTATPALTINGSSAAVTVPAGSTINVGVTNGPGNMSDWVMMVPAGSPAQTWGTYMYLSGSKTRPAAGLTTATVPFTALGGGGQFEFRFYQNDTFTLLATSAVVTVQVVLPALTINGSSGTVTVAAGSTINVGVTNGPGNMSDWVMMVPAGSPAQTWGTYMYLSGSKTRPAAGLTTATVPFTAVGGGQFEFRFYQNDTFTLLATSAVVTVSPD